MGKHSPVQQEVSSLPECRDGRMVVAAARLLRDALRAHAARVDTESDAYGLAAVPEVRRLVKFTKWIEALDLVLAGLDDPQRFARLVDHCKAEFLGNFRGVNARIENTAERAARAEETLDAVKEKDDLAGEASQFSAINPRAAQTIVGKLQIGWDKGIAEALAALRQDVADLEQVVAAAKKGNVHALETMLCEQPGEHSGSQRTLDFEFQQLYARYWAPFDTECETPEHATLEAVLDAERVRARFAGDLKTLCEMLVTVKQDMGIPLPGQPVIPDQGIDPRFQRLKQRLQKIRIILNAFMQVTSLAQVSWRAVLVHSVDEYLGAVSDINRQLELIGVTVGQISQRIAEIDRRIEREAEGFSRRRLEELRMHFALHTKVLTFTLAGTPEEQRAKQVVGVAFAVAAQARRGKHLSARKLIDALEQHTLLARGNSTSILQWIEEETMVFDRVGAEQFNRFRLTTVGVNVVSRWKKALPADVVSRIIALFQSIDTATPPPMKRTPALTPEQEALKARGPYEREVLETFTLRDRKQVMQRGGLEWWEILGYACSAVPELRTAEGGQRIRAVMERLLGATPPLLEPTHIVRGHQPRREGYCPTAVGWGLIEEIARQVAESPDGGNARRKLFQQFGGNTLNVEARQGVFAAVQAAGAPPGHARPS